MERNSEKVSKSIVRNGGDTIMRQFSLNLDVTQQGPVVALKNLTALLDTGACIPVWTDDEEILVSDLGAKLVKKDIPFTGFGGTTHGNLYQVTLEVGDLVFQICT